MTDKNAVREFLHSGILGQRWGVRRFRNYDGTLTEEGKKRYSDSDRNESPVEPYYSDDALSAMKYRQLGVQALSNDELTRLVTRERLEMQYSDLQRDRVAKAQAARGKSFTEKTLDSLQTAAKYAGAIGSIAEAGAKVYNLKKAISGDRKPAENANEKAAKDMQNKASIEKSRTEIMEQKKAQHELRWGGNNKNKQNKNQK